MRLLSAPLLCLLITTPAMADDLFSKTELRCVLDAGGTWDFTTHPLIMRPEKPTYYRFHSIDIDGGVAHSGLGFDAPVTVIKGRRSLTFGIPGQMTIVLAKREMAGFPVISQSVETHIAGFCD